MPASTSALSTELLGLHPTRISDDKGPVVLHELLLQLNGRLSIDVFRKVCDDGLSNSLADGVDLGGVSSTLDTHANVDRGEGVLTGDEDGLVDLEAEDLRLDETDWGAVDVNESAALLGVCYRGGGLGVSDMINYMCRYSRGGGGNVPSFCRKSGRPLLLKPFCTDEGKSAGLATAVSRG